MDIADIEPQHVTQFLLDLQSRDLRPQYIHAHFRVLRTFFNWCIGEDFLVKSPLRNLKLPRLPKEGRSFISEEQLDRLLAFCPPSIFTGARNRALILLFWTTGARRAEIAQLALDDLDWKRDRIRMFGKGARERYVPFLPEAKKAVWRYLNYRRDEHLQLWITEERTPMAQAGIVIALRRLFIYAGLKGEVQDLCHGFRRTWAYRNLQAGRSIKHLMAVGGWESEQMLLRYVRAMESEDALAGKWV